MGPAMEPHIRSGLLDAMFFAGLSDKLIDALESISTR
jgi:serine/threonine-protein kinase mTOR